MDDLRTVFTPEVQALLRQLDQALMSMPAEHRERIVRELLAEVHHKIATVYRTPPNRAHAAPETIQQVRTLKQQLVNLQIQRARLGIGAPRDLDVRIGQIMAEIRALDPPPE
jgi:hypothetical protein